uniref:Uncharacterized protein n=1 Tax=Octactis speculum TaxID=3111310 RepID=A0A7S2DCZ3_9STRA
MHRPQDEEAPRAKEALRELRKYLPTDVVGSAASIVALQNRGLSKLLAKRINSKRALTLVRMHPDDIAKIHIADLRGKYSLYGLETMELRAIYANAPSEFQNDGSGEKAAWRAELIEKVQKLQKETSNSRMNRAYQGSEARFDCDTEPARANVTKTTAFAKTVVPERRQSEASPLQKRKPQRRATAPAISPGHLASINESISNATSKGILAPAGLLDALNNLDLNSPAKTTRVPKGLFSELVKKNTADNERAPKDLLAELATKNTSDNDRAPKGLFAELAQKNTTANDAPTITLRSKRGNKENMRESRNAIQAELGGVLGRWNESR